MDTPEPSTIEDGQRPGRYRFLLELNDRLRPLADPVAVQREASRALGMLVGASRVGYAEILDDGETSVVTVNYTDGVRGIEGRYRVADYNPALMRAIRESGCEGFVSMLGMRSDAPELARAMDLHVLASCGAEAFPNAVAETMLSGTPNVVTDVGDSALIVGDAGWVVPPRSPDQLADAIVAAVRLKADGAAWEQRRVAARERIAQSFTEERMAEAYADVWYRLAASRAGTATA